MEGMEEFLKMIEDTRHDLVETLISGAVEPVTYSNYDDGELLMKVEYDAGIVLILAKDGDVIDLSGIIGTSFFDRNPKKKERLFETINQMAAHHNS